MKPCFLLAICLAASAAAQTTADNVKPAPPVTTDGVAAATVNEPLLAARALMKKGQLKDAAAAFKALVEKDATSAEAHAGLVRCLLRTNQLDEADGASKKALAALPSSALVHTAVGDVAFRSGNFGDAEKEYRAALKIDTNSARGVYGMGRMLQMVSMNKRAKENFARAHQLDPEDGQITNHWLETLPYVERLEQVKKMDGDQDEKANRQRYLTALAAKKPWVLLSEIKPMEIKMPQYGRKVEYVMTLIAVQKPSAKGMGFESRSMIARVQTSCWIPGRGESPLAANWRRKPVRSRFQIAGLAGLGTRAPLKAMKHGLTKSISAAWSSTTVS